MIRTGETDHPTFSLKTIVNTTILENYDVKKVLVCEKMCHAIHCDILEEGYQVFGYAMMESQM